MKQIVGIFIGLYACMFFSHVAFACDAGYYDNNGTCTACKSGYYCPGDDVMYPCPSTQDFDNAAAAAEPDLVSITSQIYSWGEGNFAAGSSINVCRARPKLVTHRGSYYYSVLYDTTTQSYPFNSPSKYWDSAYTGYYLSNHYSGVTYFKCNACTNAPAHAHYTGAGTPDVGDCPWECDAGYWNNNGTCTACPNTYPLSAAGSDEINDCYLTTTATKYVATAGAGETTCTANNYCAGGATVYYNGTGGNTACGSGLYAPAGMSNANQCGRILHIGDEVVYLHSVKKTSPALHVKVGNDIYYGNATTADVVMHTGSTHKLKVTFGGTTYSIYDDTVTLPAE